MPANEKVVARNYERVLTARLRDARFFWDADRQVPLDERIERLHTIRFHKKLGSYFEKSQRVEKLARWIATEPLQSPALGDAAAAAGRLAKADLATEMVAELTELQGVMGGIYAREEGQPERVWKAIYYHYLPDSVAADAPPTRQQLGDAAVSWAAVSLADKLDTVVGMFYAGEKPTGSRDPFGLRRQAHGIFKILVDLPSVDGAFGPSAALHAARRSRERVCAAQRMARGKPGGDERRSCSTDIATCSSIAVSTFGTCARCCSSRGSRC